LRLIILLAFFVSGLCALVYEVVWTRLLGLVMGNTVYAVSTTLAAFMAGLALGSYLFGKLADRLQRPGRFYGILELVIGLYCLVLPLLIAGADPLYSFVYRKFSASFGMMTGIRFVTAGFILLLPAVLMGATLPVLSRLYASQRDRLGWEIGRLYAINTCGAVAGTLLAGFLLLPGLGVRSSLGAAAAANIALGIIVLAATRKERGRKIRTVPQGDASGRSMDERASTAAAAVRGAGGSDEPAPGVGARGDHVPAGTAKKTRARRPAAKVDVREGPFLTVALAFAISGMAALIYEVAWTRIISLLIGPSAYAFSLMLACFLVGLAIGSALGARWIDRWRNRSLRVMGLLLVAVAVFALVLLPVLSGAAPLVREITRKFSQSFGPLYFSYFGLAALVLLPPTIALGAVFPAAVSAAAPGLKNVGKRIGLLYCGNTVGAIAGSVIAGFALIPALGLEKTVAVGAICHFIAACVLFIKGKDVRFAGLAIAAGILGVVFLPRWDVKALNSGPYRYLYSGKDAAKAITEERDLLYYKEGITATVAVVRSEAELALTIDGKVDASIGADMDTQIMLAQLPLLMSPEPRHALVIGLASGVTLGSVERHKELESIDCVEISPEVIEACGFFKDYNYDALSDPRLRMIVHDARNYLKLTDRKYDVIISEPSNPWMPGSAALFTREFFDNCLSRLGEGGIMCQWLQAYNIPPALVQSVVATFCDVFPNVHLWTPLKGDLILLGSDAPLHIDPEVLQQRMSQPALRNDLSRMNLTRWQELVGLYLGGGNELCGSIAGGPLQTDNRPTLEYTLPKVLHRARQLTYENLKWMAMPLGGFALNVRGSEEVREEARLSAASYKDFLQGNVNEIEGNFNGALLLYDRALRGTGGRRAAMDPMYLLLCRMAIEAEREEGVEISKEIYRRAISLSPDRGEAHYFLGMSFMRADRFHEAAGELEIAVANDSLQIQPAIALAEVLSLIGRHDEARRASERAVMLGPGDPTAWYGAARVYTRAGLLAEAKRALERAAAIAGEELRAKAATDPVLGGVVGGPDRSPRADSQRDSVMR
jgi:spermidine synthase